MIEQIISVCLTIVYVEGVRIVLGFVVLYAFHFWTRVVMSLNRDLRGILTHLNTRHLVMLLFSNLYRLAYNHTMGMGVTDDFALFLKRPIMIGNIKHVV